MVHSVRKLNSCGEMPDLYGYLVQPGPDLALPAESVYEGSAEKLT